MKFCKTNIVISAKWIRTVTSTLTMSPSINALSSGIPWQATLFTDEQTDFGNPPYRNGDGYAFASIIFWCTKRSISSVVVPIYLRHSTINCNLTKKFLNYCLTLIKSWQLFRMFDANLQVSRICSISWEFFISGVDPSALPGGVNS